MKETVTLIEKLRNEVETVNEFRYLGNRPKASGSCEAAVSAKVRIGWVRFKRMRELLLEDKFPLKMKSKVYRCCVRLAILYGSQTWCLKK